MKYYGIPLKNQLNIESLMSFYHFYFDEDYKSIGERHNFWEIVYVKNGSIGVTADTRFYELKTGMMVFHKPNEFHKLWSSRGTRPEIYVFSFLCEDSILDAFKGRIVELNDFEKTLLEHIANELSEKTTYINKKADEHIFSLKSGETAEDLQIAKASLELLISNLRNSVSVDKKTLTANLSLTHEDIFNDAVKFLKLNLSENILIEDICKEINVSSTTLKRIFKKYTGDSIKKYFHNLKIEKSKEMLKQGLQIGYIADALGFSSQNYFCYAFKRETGETPFSYKTKVRG